MGESKRKVYFDNMANTQPDPRVVEAIIPHLKNTYGNPLNIHDYGQKSLTVIDEARQKTADLIEADPKEIIFTSCGSESNNFAIKGIAKANEKKGKHIISSAIEHFSILYELKELEKEGFKVTYLPVDKFGLIDPEAVFKAITPETIMVTITHSSNEIGTIEPIAEIASKVKEKGVIFHTDAVQTAGNIPLDVKKLNVDALTLSSNQFYGPSGVAALYLKKGTRIIPFIYGGTQEEGKRAGTNNIPGIVGIGKAAELAKAELSDRANKMTPLRDKLLKELPSIMKDVRITGDIKNRLPGHASICIKYIEGESMSMFLNMEGIAVSTGSACSSKALKASHVLLAIGVRPEDVHGSLVFSLGKDSTMEDVDHVIEKLPPIVKRLRGMSPLSKKGDEK